ncbi:unnamed protein product, partial [Adineta ricciae]
VLFFSYQAVEFAINATEHFFNDLRQEIGNDSFDRLFVINPADAVAQEISNEVAQGKRFRFFTPYITASVKKSDDFITNLKNTIKYAYNKVLSFLSNIVSKTSISVPTYDISDMGVNIKDADNVRAAPFVLSNQSSRRKRRLIHDLRRRA